MKYLMKVEYLVGGIMLLLVGCTTLDKDTPKEVMNHPGASDSGMPIESQL